MSQSEGERGSLSLPGPTSEKRQHPPIAGALQARLRTIARSGAVLSTPIGGLSIRAGRLQERDQLAAILGRCEPAIRLHTIAGQDLIGFRDEAVELLLIHTKSAPFMALE